MWQAFATRNKLALVACRFTDKPHDQSFIEEYVERVAGQRPGAARRASRTSRRARRIRRLPSAPLLFWGMSAGGQFNYEFAAWKPERVAAFVVNKGGIYYTALDLARHARRAGHAVHRRQGSRIRASTRSPGCSSLNRRGGALWALAEEPGAAHVVGRSRDVSIMFFDDVLPMRLGATAGAPLRPLDERSGFLGDIKTKDVRAEASNAAGATGAAWFPTRAGCPSLARAGDGNAVRSRSGAPGARLRGAPCRGHIGAMI